MNSIIALVLTISLSLFGWYVPLEEDTSIVSINFTGDVCFGRPEGNWGKWVDYYKEEGPDYFFSEIKPVFDRADYTVVNLENVFTDTIKPYPGKIWAYRAPLSYVDVLRDSGITHASVVNNHTHDYHQQGLDDTVDALYSLGITPFGYSMTDMKTPELGGGVKVDITSVIDHNGVKVGLLSYFGFYGVYVTEAEVRDHISLLKEDRGVDFVVVSVHWGGQNTKTLTGRQKNYGRMFVDNGADLVIGNHPHTLQSMEEYKGKRIYYALGDLLFVHKGLDRSNVSAIIRADFIKYPDESLDIRFEHIPVHYSSSTSVNNYKPGVLEDEWAKEYVDKWIRRTREKIYPTSLRYN